MRDQCQVGNGTHQCKYPKREGKIKRNMKESTIGERERERERERGRGYVLLLEIIQIVSVVEMVDSL